jgi:D-alanyl-D-alanine carboxypeptidase
MKSLLLLSSMVVLLSGCAAEPSLLDREFQETLDTARLESGIPGATAAYVLPNGQVRRFATGTADSTTMTPMRPESRMLAGSVGKMFCAATALDLAVEGQIDLDGHIATWLGDESWFPRLRGGADMTLRHLLTHSAGVYDHLSDPEFLAVIADLVSPESDPDSCLTHRQIVEYLLDQDPYFPVGQGFHYTDGGYILVGLIIEKVTGREFYAEAEDRFIKPMGLDLTSPSDRRDLPGLACGYLQADNPFGMQHTTLENGLMNHNPALEWTGGGYVSNPGDLVLWAKALYEGEAIDGDYLTDLLDSVPWDAESPDQRRYGPATIIDQTALGRSLGHSGWYPGYHTLVMYFPEHEISVAIQVNRDHESHLRETAMELAHRVIDSLQ